MIQSGRLPTKGGDSSKAWLYGKMLAAPLIRKLKYIIPFAISSMVSRCA